VVVACATVARWGVTAAIDEAMIRGRVTAESLWNHVS
jgi:hypothetical protein